MRSIAWWTRNETTMDVCVSQKDCYERALQIENAAQNSTLYSPNLFPYTGTNITLNVTMTILIYKLISLTNDKVLSLAMEIDLGWYDPNFPADWSSFPSYTQLFIKTADVWSINLYIMNSGGDQVYLQPTDLTYLFPPTSGNRGAIVTTSTISKFVSDCSTMNLTEYPFDQQECSMLLAYGDSTVQRNVQFVFPANLVMSQNPEDSEWQILNVSVTPTDNFLRGSNYVGFTINLSFKRNSFYHVLFLIIPIVLLTAVGILTIVLPADRGEKVILGATVVVSMYVLITSINQQIPQIEPSSVPRIVTALEYGTVMTAIALFEAVSIQSLRIVAFALPATCCYCLSCLPFLRNQLLFLKLLDAEEEKNGIVIGKQRLECKHHSLSDSLEIELLQRMIEDLQKRRKKKYMKNLWRNIELFVNIIFFAVYIGAIIYFFGVYIYE